MRLRLSRTAIRLSVVAAILLAGGLLSQGPTQAASGDPVQDFNPDVLECLSGTTVDPTVSQATWDAFTCAGENLGLGASPGQATSIRLPEGARLALPFTYSRGWTYPAPTVGTQYGGVQSIIDFQCDGNLDGFSDSTYGYTGNSTANPEQVLARSTAWESSTDASGLSEVYLNSIAPNSETTATDANIPFLRSSRYRADINTIWLGLSSTGGFTLDPPTVLNTMSLQPKWAPSDTRVSVALLGGPSSSPSQQLLCLQAPQNSQSTISGSVVTNPAANGVFVRFTVFLSAGDIYNNTQQVKIIPNCKQIGTGATDADLDCLADSAEAGLEVGDADADDDGLLDGWEVAWGSNPLVADTDADGRTDFEEILGPAAYLTDPNKVDTDGDGVNDGGLTLDPAALPTITTETNHGTSRKTVSAGIKKASPFGPLATSDNCPNVNGAQTNTDNPTTATDKTPPNGDTFGDLCDNDRDNDSITNLAEAGNRFIVGPYTCSQSGGTAAALLPLVADTNNDGMLDARECVRGVDPTGVYTPGQINNFTNDCPAPTGPNPNITNASPLGGCGSPADKDGLPSAWETDRQTVNVTCSIAAGCAGQIDSDADNDGLLGGGDADSDEDGVSDGIEVLMKGTSPINRDSDRDGVCDTVEILSLDGDTKVGLGDVTQIALSFNAVEPTGAYSSNKDLNGDGKVGLGDVTKVALKWNLVNTACSRDLIVP